MDTEELRYAYSFDGKEYNSIGKVYDESILIDEYGSLSGYTGAFIGLCAQDLSGEALSAEFDYFEYVEFV